MGSHSVFRWFVLIIFVFSLNACAPGDGKAAESILPRATLAETVRVEVTPTPKAVQISPTPSLPVEQKKNLTATLVSEKATLPMAALQGPLSVIIKNPLDDTVVQNARLDLSGEADPETVISIDDQFELVGQDRSFVFHLTLDEGPNVIEITASDPYENQGTVYLTVTYDPQP